jgi:hypothetical protein
VGVGQDDGQRLLSRGEKAIYSVILIECTVQIFNHAHALPVVAPSAQRMHAVLLAVSSHTCVWLPPKERVHTLPIFTAGASGGPPSGRENSGRAW